MYMVILTPEWRQSMTCIGDAVIAELFQLNILILGRRITACNEAVTSC